MNRLRLLFFLLASGMALGLVVAACTEEEEEGSADVTPTVARIATKVAATTSDLPTPQPAPHMAFGEPPGGEVVVGIGVYLGQNPMTQEMVIMSPLLDSPAYRAGVQAGDVILAVDGKPASEWIETEAMPSIRGTEGTEVTLSVRHGDGSEQDLTITRETIGFPRKIPVESVGIFLLDGTVPGVIVTAYPSYRTRAERADIEHYDLILAVNGESTAAWTASEVADRITGLGGDQFTMTVRHMDGVTEEVTLRPASEFCQLLIPGTYMGVVYLNGDVAPVGSTITAEQGGVTWGSTTVEDAGFYILDTLAVDVPRESPPCSPDGPISFRMGDLIAKESVDWRSGLVDLNLTFESPPTVTPAVGAAP
jgi:membrane-associated protease RseP (regulator of RpoE activity)